VLSELGDCATATFGPAGDDDWFPANGDPFRVHRGGDFRVEMTLEPRCPGRTDEPEFWLWNLIDTCDNGDHVGGRPCAIFGEVVTFRADSALDGPWSEHVLWSDVPVRISVCAVSP